MGRRHVRSTEFNGRVDAGREHGRLPRAVEFIKRNIKLDSAEKALDRRQQEGRRDLHAVRQKGMFNHLLTIFFSTLASPASSPLLHRPYLYLDRASSACSRPSSWPTQAAPGTTPRSSSRSTSRSRAPPFTAATVVGDTVGDPFKDTSFRRHEPVIKFTTLFGLLAGRARGGGCRGQCRRRSRRCSSSCRLVFVWRSFLRDAHHDDRGRRRGRVQGGLNRCGGGRALASWRCAPSHRGRGTERATGGARLQLGRCAPSHRRSAATG